MPTLIHEFIAAAAKRTPHAEALVYQSQRLDYATLAKKVDAAATALLSKNLQRSERVAVYLEKRPETVIALFAAAAAGGVFVPVNPLLKAAQVAYILGDCNVRILVTSVDRLKLLIPELAHCPDLHTVLLVDGASETALPVIPGVRVMPWCDTEQVDLTAQPHPSIDSDMAAILYTSGSTGQPKGVVLSHRNLVAGAESVAGYLGNTAEDRILAVLPFSFDYGLSQLTTAFRSGAAVVLMNHLFPRDVIKMVVEERITGLAAVPPLWMQLMQLPWPQTVHLRYLTNSGGAMPRPTLDSLRSLFPAAQIFLMYGLTEAFRSTFLPPAELDRRPDSMGRAIPNADVMVVRPDGTPCAVNEPGELVHRGALVSLGYWNDPIKTAERFKPSPGRDPALPLAELAVWSGDTVRMDQDGFFYFIGRDDDMIKVSGYRVSPTEVEQALHATAMLLEVAAFGIAHPALGQAIVAIAVTQEDGVSSDNLRKACRQHLPAYMVPAHIEIWHKPLPRNPNGKIDRKTLQQSLSNLFDPI